MPRPSKTLTCPECRAGVSKVIDSRPGSNKGVRRRRECLKCQHRWTTVEVSVLNSQRALQQELKVEYRRQIVSSLQEDFRKAIDIVFQHINEA